MHLPYLLKCFAGRPFKLVPIIVGALTPASEEVCNYLTRPASRVAIRLNDALHNT